MPWIKTTRLSRNRRQHRDHRPTSQPQRTTKTKPRVAIAQRQPARRPRMISWASSPLRSSWCSICRGIQVSPSMSLSSSKRSLILCNQMLNKILKVISRTLTRPTRLKWLLKTTTTLRKTISQQPKKKSKLKQSRKYPELKEVSSAVLTALETTFNRKQHLLHKKCNRNRIKT